MIDQPICDETSTIPVRRQLARLYTRLSLLLAILLLATAFLLSTLAPTPIMANEPHPIFQEVGGFLEGEIARPITHTIGYSTQGRPIEAVQFGDGPRHLVLIGGIHGGAEWNTVLLGHQAVDFFRQHPEALPAEIMLTIIPVANPDGLARVFGHAGPFSAAEAMTANATNTDGGRFNSRNVDLNRNWACSWRRVGYWGAREVSGGFVPFSEAETRALGAFLTKPLADGVIFWHSAAVGVYAGGCNARFAPSDALGRAYADGSGYPFQLAFSHYPITGDATDWLATKGIPAVVVELRGRTDTEWASNQAGIEAVFAHLAEGGVHADKPGFFEKPGLLAQPATQSTNRSDGRRQSRSDMTKSR